MPQPRGVKISQKTRQRACASFLAELRKHGLVNRAVLATSVSRNVLYQWRRDDPVFAQAWGEAIEEANEALEAEIFKRGVEGVDEDVFGRVGKDQDGKIGTIRRYSDQLLLRLASARMPDRWRQHVTTTNREEPLPPVDWSQVPDAMEVQFINGEISLAQVVAYVAANKQPRD